MLPALAASAAAARAVGYPGLANLIESDGIGPEQIAALLKLSCSKCACKDYALIILAGAVGRYRACPEGWTGEPERSLAQAVLTHELDPEAALRKLSERASGIVKAHWREIRQAAA
jgi:hypothetical protein